MWLHTNAMWLHVSMAMTDDSENRGNCRFYTIDLTNFCMSTYNQYNNSPLCLIKQSQRFFWVLIK